MTTIAALRKQIRSMRRQGRKDSAIAKHLGVDQAEIKRILVKYPGERVAKRLGIPVKCHACHRKLPTPTVAQTPPAKSIGRDAGWFEYWTRPIRSKHE